MKGKKKIWKVKNWKHPKEKTARKISKLEKQAYELKRKIAYLKADQKVNQYVGAEKAMKELYAIWGVE